MNSHRNSQKRIYIKDAVYFVTSKTWNNGPFFREAIFCDLFVEELRVCKRLKNFKLYGWVVIYDHIHLLIGPGDEFDYSEVMHFLKRHFSRNTNIVMGYTHERPITVECTLKPPSISEGAVGQPRLQSGGVSRPQGEFGKFSPDVRRLELCVTRARLQFIFKYENHNPFPKFRWQKSFRDHYLRDERDFFTHLGYIAGNPDKHRLPINWQYVFSDPNYAALTDSS